MRRGIFAASGGSKPWPPGFSSVDPGWPESVSTNFTLQSLDYTSVVIEYNDTATESVSTNFTLQSLDYSIP